MGEIKRHALASRVVRTSPQEHAIEMELPFLSERLQRERRIIPDPAAGEMVVEPEPGWVIQEVDPEPAEEIAQP